MHLRWWRAALAALACFVLPGLEAAEPIAGTLTLNQAIGRAVDHRPELAAFAFELRAREARARQADLKPAPELEFLVEDALGTGGHSGLRAAQATLMLSQVLEMGDKRSARLAIAQADIDALGNNRAIGQLDVVGDVATRFVEVVRAQARHQLALEAVRLAEETDRKVQERVQAARSPLAEAARSAAALIDAQVALEDTEHDLEIARRFLAAAMGEPEARFGEASGDLTVLSPVAPLEQLIAGLAQSPDLLQYADTQRLRDAELKLALLQQRANLRANVGVRRLEQSDDVALVVGVTMPLFAARHAQPQVDASKARVERVQVERETAFLKLQANLYSTYLQMEHARGLAGRLRDELIPRLQNALDLTTEAYERGRYSYQELSAAQRELHAGRSRLLETFADFQLLRLEIERLSGRSLEANGVTP